MNFRHSFLFLLFIERNRNDILITCITTEGNPTKAVVEKNMIKLEC
jgi:hypothetical protein